MSFEEYRGHDHRAAAGNARPADPEGHLTRTSARVWRSSPDPALYRLEHQGLITSEWGESENKRRAKYYRLTAAGRRRLRDELAYWQRLSEAIGLVLSAATEDV
jgi:DNA-binding PadR family transcriptional regulator